MENERELREHSGDLKNVARNTSWFRDTPHYWAEASLPLAYAVACVEIVCKSSEKARIIYKRIVEAWNDAGIKAMGEEIGSMIPESGKEKIKKAMLHPESELLPDPNRPFKKLERLFTEVEIDGELFELEGTEELENLISEFICVGFNRESDIAKAEYRVMPSEKGAWLIWAVVIRTALEGYKITFEKIRDSYKVRKYKGKLRNFQKVLKEEPMSRLHREIVASAKAANLRLKNDKTIMKAALRWYKCRVVYRSIEEFCDNEPEEEIMLDPKNVNKEIRPCDDAVGYIRRLPGKATK